MNSVKATSRTAQSLCKRSSVSILILGCLFSGVLCVYIVANGRAKTSLAEKLAEDYRKSHQVAVDRTAGKENAINLPSQEYRTNGNVQHSSQVVVTGMDEEDYQPAGESSEPQESDALLDEGKEERSGANVDSSHHPYSSATVHDEEHDGAKLAASKSQQPEEMPLEEFCASDEKKKRFLSDENKNVTASELPDSVVSSVQKIIFFVGYPRSGHSIIGSLIDSHPNMVIANEFGMFRKLIEEPDYKQATPSFLYNALYKGSVCSYYLGLRAEEATKKGYSLRVDDSWQAKYNGTIAVIGEKSGGNTCMTYLRYGNEAFLETFQNFSALVNVPVFTIHAVRSPYDNIATMALMSKKSNVSKLDLTPEDPYENVELLDWAIENYFSRVETVNKILTKLDLNVIEVHSKDLILQPKQTFSKICAILEVPCDEQYLDTVASKVFPEISKTRALIVWTPEQKTRISEEIKKYDFLHRYAFDN